MEETLDHTADTKRSKAGCPGAVGVVYWTMGDGGDSRPAVLVAVKVKNHVPIAGKTTVVVVTTPTGWT